MVTVLITDCVHTPGDAHVHPPGDVNQSIRGLPKLRVLLPTSCVQGANIMMINDRNEGANLCALRFPQRKDLCGIER